MTLKRHILTICCLLLAVAGSAQIDSLRKVVGLDSCICTFFDNWERDFRTPMPLTLDRCDVDTTTNTLHVYAKEGFASQVWTPRKVITAYEGLRLSLPVPFDTFGVRLYGFGKEISTLIPNIYRIDKDTTRLWPSVSSELPWVQNLSNPVIFSSGLQGCHLTIWPSHGRYYDSAKKKWRWQRPNLWCTTEDMFTRSFVVPFLLPMLESAGAVTFCPRERDWHSEEIIADSVLGNSILVPEIEYAGDYAVYVRYPMTDSGVPDAVYTIKHSGVETKVRVNQRMGGGTWVYLGTYHFEEGKRADNSISLSTATDYDGYVLPSEVRIGGGMGSIVRGGRTSGIQRFLEGSRYWAEYAGFPKPVYYTKDGNNDYADDINVRSNALNYLAGGSCYLPDSVGLRVPMELSVAVHTDAGWFKENRPYGTLAIYTINGDTDADTLRSGLSRMANSDLACIIQEDICRDLSAAIGEEWPHREIYNRNYSESRKPEVPSMILETLSHQNFQDMLYGHDPVFKFLLSRSIYKAITRFVATQHSRSYTIQPLPVSHFKAEALDSVVRLSWQPRLDTLESTAAPTHYIIYKAREGEDFDNGVMVNAAGSNLDLANVQCSMLNAQCFDVPVEKDVIYRFKVTACNDGGESWPSETLAALCAGNPKEHVMIVNGFTRLSAPTVIETKHELGFDINDDIGVPYVNTAEYCGAQTGFSRSKIGIASKGGLGFSGSELEGQVIAGNTFDYPAVHAEALRSNDGTRSISSCSMDALLNPKLDLANVQCSMFNAKDIANRSKLGRGVSKEPGGSLAAGADSGGESASGNVQCSMLDIIFGLQKDCGRSSIMPYKTFTPELQSFLDGYLAEGGKVFVSGSYVGSDMQSDSERQFTSVCLGYSADKSCDQHRLQLEGTDATLVSDWNPYRYAAKSVDVLQPEEGAEPFIHYHNGDCAGVAKDNAIVLGFPLEAVSDAAQRKAIIQRVVNFLRIDQHDAGI